MSLPDTILNRTLYKAYIMIEYRKWQTGSTRNDYMYTLQEGGETTRHTGLYFLKQTTCLFPGVLGTLNYLTQTSHSGCFKPDLISWKRGPACLPPGWLAGWLAGYFVHTCIDCTQTNDLQLFPERDPENYLPDTACP